MKVLVVYIVSFYPCSKIHFPLISNSLSEITIRLPFRIFQKKKCNVVKDKLNHSVKHSYIIIIIIINAKQHEMLALQQVAQGAGAT